MLPSFRVANHRSIREETELSLVATELNEHTARETGASAEGRPVSALPTVGIYGANASGKSNVLHALRFMHSAVPDSFADRSRKAGIPREPFALAAEAQEETSFFEVDLLLGKDRVRYTYGFEPSDERVEAEWLHAYPSGRRQIWFDREADRPDDEGGEFRFPGTGLKGQKDLIVTSTRPEALFLTVGATLDNPSLAAVHRWFVDNLWPVTSGGDVPHRTEWTRGKLTDRKSGAALRERIGALPAAADLGIAGLTLDPESGEVQLLHRTADGPPQALDFWNQESPGTHAWFAFLGPLFHVLDKGGVLLVDELDSSLHPILAAEVIRLFQDHEANPRPAQLIFTTHDATLLGPSVADRPLDRDQVRIALKNATGESQLSPITAARKARRDDNRERRCLHGHYGGIPRLTSGEIARQIALIEEGLRATA
ncbi:AAA family ATPase [Streptomyces incanus]|uniref:ATP/GTP-binding protein n=1 Tax=Streptomyces incanus TaxID=887453 RepID=A0ABW0XFW9_9ACTN